MPIKDEQTYKMLPEVAEMLGVSKSLIRLWEAEFDLPSLARGFFLPKDIDKIKAIDRMITEKDMPLHDAKLAFLQESLRIDMKYKTLARLREIRESLINLKESIAEDL